MRRLLGVVVHNWPLKLAAIGLATLLYGGLVLSQSTLEFKGVVPVTVENQPPDTFLLTAVEPVQTIRYFAPSGVRPIATTFTATIDLADVKPGGGRQLVPIVVASLDPRITVLGSDPDVMTVQLDALQTRTVPVVVERSATPDGLEIGDTTVEPSEVEVSGPSSVIELVVAARANVAIQPGGIDIDQDVRLVPVDQLGDAVSPVDVEPSTARVKIPVFTDRQSRTLPVTPVITGTPAAGFEIANVTVDPSVVTVEGDADQLVDLESIDTVAISVNGLSSDQTTEAELAMPAGSCRWTIHRSRSRSRFVRSQRRAASRWVFASSRPIRTSAMRRASIASSSRSVARSRTWTASRVPRSSPISMSPISPSAPTRCRSRRTCPPA